MPTTVRRTPPMTLGVRPADAAAVRRTARARPRALDGDPMTAGPRLSVETLPGSGSGADALTMLLPARGM